MPILPPPPPPAPLRPPPTLTISDEVVARRPTQISPYPDDLEAILLGTAKAPPTGTHTEPGPPRPSVAGPDPARYPAEAAAWNEAKRRWPYATQHVQGLDPMDTPSAAIAAQWDPQSRRLQFQPGLTLRMIGHELGHAAEDQAFPDPVQATAAFHNPKDSYWRETGEQRSRALERAIAGEPVTETSYTMGGEGIDALRRQARKR